MDMCPDCGNPLGDNGFTNCNSDPKCDRDREDFQGKVDAAKAALDLHVLARIERNEMPPCFEATRASTVALAGLLMEALRQNQEMLAHVPKH